MDLHALAPMRVANQLSELLLLSIYVSPRSSFDLQARMAASVASIRAPWFQVKQGTRNAAPHLTDLSHAATLKQCFSRAACGCINLAWGLASSSMLRPAVHSCTCAHCHHCLRPSHCV
jgi:hypothetical protein